MLKFYLAYAKIEHKTISKLSISNIKNSAATGLAIITSETMNLLNLSFRIFPKI